jgi:hypothetical protein
LICSRSSGVLADRYDEARGWAVKLDEKHMRDGLPGNNPSSGVWRLIDVIRHA